MPSTPKPLLPDFAVTDTAYLKDFYSVMARNIEDCLLTGGAVPGKDYSILDLYKLAQPFVLQRWNDPKKKPLIIESKWA